MDDYSLVEARVPKRLPEKIGLTTSRSDLQEQSGGISARRQLEVIDKKPARKITAKVKENDEEP